MKNHQSYSGKKFNKLTILTVDDFVIKNSTRKCLAQCECGNIKTFQLKRIIHNLTLSCGCARMGMGATHGLSKHPLYHVWHDMKRRCYDKKYYEYHLYGGRGISICDEWLQDVSLFVEWGLENGWGKGLQIDRENNNENYTADNCRFVTPLVNTNNRRITSVVNVGGKLESTAMLSRKSKVKPDTFKRRIKLGWSLEKIFSEGPKEMNKLHEFDGVLLTMPQWSEKTGINISTLYKRARRGTPLIKPSDLTTKI